MASKDSGVYIVADMACSHEGDLSLARKIIDAAGNAGADAVQFQIWSREEILVPTHPDTGLLKKIEISQSGWRELFKYTKANYPSMDIIACVYSPSWISFCEEMGCYAYKIHTSDLSNHQLLRCVARTGKRIDLSIGASSLVEIQEAMDSLSRTPSFSGDLCLMYGSQNFPTSVCDVHLKYMKKIQQLFEVKVGYQDHSDGGADAAFWLPAAAIGCGAGTLEKHITYDRSLKGTDYQAALDPLGFKMFVEMVRIVWDSMGTSVPHPFTPSEKKYRLYSKKSIVAATRIRRNAILTENNISFLRTGKDGLSPQAFDFILGMRASRDIEAYEPIEMKDLK